MTIDELVDRSWSEMSFSKHLAGRPMIDRLVKKIIRRVPTDIDGNPSRMIRDVVRSARSEEKGMGIILSIILSVIISELVKIVFAWIRERRVENTTQVHEWQREAVYG